MKVRNRKNGERRERRKRLRVLQPPSHNMTSRLTFFTIILGICLVSIIPTARAFGAGNIPAYAYLEDRAFRHGDIEDILAEMAKTTTKVSVTPSPSNMIEPRFIVACVTLDPRDFSAWAELPGSLLSTSSVSTLGTGFETTARRST